MTIERLVDTARRLLPRSVRHGVQRLVPLTSLKRRYFAARDPLSGIEFSDDNRFGSPVRVGIIRNQASFHRAYVKACLELGIPFRVLDVARSDWLDVVRSSGCGLFMVWPDAMLTTWARLMKDRCDIIERQLGLPVVPRSAERWLYEDKCRTRDWLLASGVPHPRTWVFFHREEAEAFAATCTLPIVFKTFFGAAATGVRIVRSRRHLRALVRRAFAVGHVAAGHDRRDRQWGSIMLQEYLPDVKEWRMVRIGDAYFGHTKLRVGDYHSGSGAAGWDVPESRHLDLLHEVTELGGFRSMGMDVFETPDGRLLVNELQTVFGASVSVDQMRIDGVAGCMVREGEGRWRFEAGDHARNACANARILDALVQLGSDKAPLAPLGDPHALAGSMHESRAGGNRRPSL